MSLARPDLQTLKLDRDGGVLRVTLDRPEVRNALSSEMVAELREVFDAAAASADVRCVVLRGAGGTLSAGGDVREIGELLRQPASANADPLLDANRAYGDLLTRVDRLPRAVVCVAEGAALGGGLGLVCASDVALAADGCRFGMPEARLGLLPAQILPFVVRRIGWTQARRLAVTGATFGGREARRLGLVHESFPDARALEAALDETLQQIAGCGPAAVAAAKSVLHAAGEQAHEDLLDRAAELFARTARSEEGQEGIAAFLEKRKPPWG